jgi:hypothetical protein
MKAISVWEPWASLLACGHKWYETRSWTPPIDCMRVRDIAIHAGKSRVGMEYLGRDARLAAICDQVLGADFADRCETFGSVIAVGQISRTIATEAAQAVDVTEREKAMGDWSPGRYGWRFVDVRKLSHPVPCRGMQKLFELPLDVIERIYDRVEV